MPAIDHEPALRTRGSAKLLDAWGTFLVGTAEPEPVDHDDLRFWHQSLRTHGGKPCPPRLCIDGVGSTELIAGGFHA